MATCGLIFWKFGQRTQAFSDEEVTIEFKKQQGSPDSYDLSLFSERMKTSVISKGYKGTWLEEDDQQSDTVKVVMRKDMYVKFFSLFKLQGSGIFRITSGQVCELEFYCDKSPFFSVHLEAACKEF